MSLARETLTRVVPLPDQHVTVADPDNFLGSPAFEGLASDARRHLITGDYPATTTDGTPVRLLVTHFDSVITADIPALVERQSDLQAYFALIYRCQQRHHARTLATLPGTPEAERANRVGFLLQARRERVASDLHETNAAILAAGGCPSCASGTPVPHTASRACRSGGRNHCTCDTCF